MLKDDVLQLIQAGEGAKCEFKRDDVRPDRLAREIVAFANMNGGRIILGVEDNGNICGISRSNLQEWLMDTVIGRHVDPYILPDYEEIEIESGKKVAVIGIQQGAAKPYMLAHQDRRDIYVRYGNVCRLADRTQQARLFESGGFISAEKFPVHGSQLSDLSRLRYEHYFSKLLETPEPVTQSMLLHHGFLLNTEMQTTPCCSVFAYALFGKTPGIRLPQSCIRVTVHPKPDKDYQTDLDEILDFPYVALLDREAEDVTEAAALHERAITLMRPHISREEMIGATRTRIWDYPEASIREAVVNALIHRDWTKNGYARVDIYPDRLEVTSPGALPNGLTIEKIKSGATSSRNQESIRIFRAYGYLEDQGMGIRRKIIPLCLEHSGKEPDFEATEDHFKVTLYKREN